MGTGSILYFDFCSCTLENCLLHPTSQAPTSPPAFPNALNTGVPARVHSYSCLQCSSPSTLNLLLQISPAWCPSTALQPLSSSSTLCQTRQTSKKFLLNFKNCVGSLKEAGERGIKPRVAEILTSGLAASPPLNLSILNCYLSQHRTSGTSLGLPSQLMNQSKSERNWMNFKHSCK